MACFLELLKRSFAGRAGFPALVHESRTYSYIDLEKRVRACAARFQALGVVAGDRVALASANKLPFVVAHLATLYSGAVSLPLNPRFTRDELRYFLADSGARLAVVEDEQFDTVATLRFELSDLQVVLKDSEAWEAPAGLFHEPAIHAEDACLMMYSSGTTGWPKAVVHTQANMASALQALATCWRFSPDDTVLNVLPLFHVHGLCFATLVSLLSGACVRLEERFDVMTTLEGIRHATVFMGVPTIYYRFLEQPEFRAMARSWSRLRLVTCGSAPIRAEVLPDLESIIDRPIINRYGMTEAHVITSLPLDGPWPNGSVGVPLDGIQVRIVDADGQCAPPNQVGSVQISGPNLFREYWNKPDATRAAFVDGWFDSGDLGYLDDSGYLTLVGRKNDLIISNGFNIYPQVVERVISECPGVRECAVFGVPDPRRGERVVAVVVRSDLNLDESGLRAFWTDRLVDYQRPIDLLFVESLPRNAMGKVLRRDLRERFLR